MVRHEITLSDLSDFRIEREIAGSYGKGAHKSLVCVVDISTMNAHFEIFEHRNLSATVDTLCGAIKAYNAI